MLISEFEEWKINEDGVRWKYKKPSQLWEFSGKKVWWQCKNNNKHEWNTSISGRTFRKNGCPICYKEKNRKLSIKTNDIRLMELRIWING
jgi:hypothetical protein